MSSHRKPSRGRVILAGVGVVALLGAGAGIGAATASTGSQQFGRSTIDVGTATSRAEPTTERTTVTEQAAPTTVYVPQVPSECLAALDDADQALSVAADGFGITADMMQAVSDMNPYQLQQLVDDLDALKPNLDSALSAYKSDRASCRGAS